MRQPDITIQGKPIWFSINTVVQQNIHYVLGSRFADSHNKVRSFFQFFSVDDLDASIEILEYMAYNMTIEFLTDYMKDNNVFISFQNQMEIEEIILSKLKKNNHHYINIDLNDELPSIETILYFGGLGNKLLRQEVKFEEKE